jgi:hypothetical protein
MCVCFCWVDEVDSHWGQKTKAKIGYKLDKKIKKIIRILMP